MRRPRIKDPWPVPVETGCLQLCQQSRVETQLKRNSNCRAPLSLGLEANLHLRLNRHLELGQIDAELVDVTPATGDLPTAHGRANGLDLDRTTVETAHVADEMAVDLDVGGQAVQLIATHFHAILRK